jgi:hypothetical protein
MKLIACIAILLFYYKGLCAAAAMGAWLEAVVAAARSKPRWVRTSHSWHDFPPAPSSPRAPRLHRALQGCWGLWPWYGGGGFLIYQMGSTGGLGGKLGRRRCR